MIDPEIRYRALTSGDPGALAARAFDLAINERNLDDAGDDIYAATGVPVWVGDGATSFQGTAATLLKQVRSQWVVVSVAQGGLEAVAKSYRTAVDDADQTIASWRHRPTPLLPVLETLFAAIVDRQLHDIADAYDRQLSAVVSVLNGDADQLDLDSLDDDTRDWVEDGLKRIDDWYDGGEGGDGQGSSSGPLIPNTKASGDDRGLTPQGLGYDPGSGLLLQTYYKDGEPAVLSLIDPATGREVNEVELGSGSDSTPSIGHAGGVTVVDGQAVVSSGGHLYTYDLDDLQNASSGSSVLPSGAPQPVAGDASYTTFHDGRLYVGDFDDDTVRVYERDGAGGWEPVTDPTTHEPLVIDAPAKTQGLVVRDGQYLWSTSEGRSNGSQIIVQDRDTGERDPALHFPNMSEGLVEADGSLLTTYESGASKYDHLDGLWNRLTKDLWASPYLTVTPLSALGLAQDLDVEPATLRNAASHLHDPATALNRLSGALADTSLPASLFGDVPSAGSASSALELALGTASDGTRAASQATTQMAESLQLAAVIYHDTDDGVGSRFRDMSP